MAECLSERADYHHHHLLLDNQRLARCWTLAVLLGRAWSPHSLMAAMEMSSMKTVMILPPGGPNVRPCRLSTHAYDGQICSGRYARRDDHGTPDPVCGDAVRWTSHVCLLPYRVEYVL